MSSGRSCLLWQANFKGRATGSQKNAPFDGVTQYWQVLGAAVLSAGPDKEGG